MSPAGTGMAQAYICRVDDPSAVWYNPAALTRLEGNNLAISTTWTHSTSDFTPRFRSDIINSGGIDRFPSNVFVSHELSPDSVLAIGIYSPFGFKTQWPGDSTASFINQDFHLKSFYITPSLGFKVTPNLSIGGGMDFVFASLNMDRNISLAPDSPAIPAEQIQADGTDFGFNLGALVQTNSNWQFALTYKNKLDVNMNGDVVFINVPALFRPVFPDGSINITVPLPSQIMLGTATKYNNFSFEGDIIWTRWRVFEAIRVNFDRNTPPDQNLRRAFQNTWSLRIGADYHWMERYTFRAGYFRDETPVPEKAVDPILPDASRNGITAGFGYNVGNVSLDVGYMKIIFKDRIAPVDNFSSPLAAGAYSSDSTLLTFGVSYKFSK
jgi:long-chain fatty acid transport protein